MDVMEAARLAEENGRRIIHMELGQPGTSAPQAARDGVIRRMSEDALGYTVAKGLPELRERIAQLYKEWYDIDLDPDRVVVTPGSSGGFILAFTALFDAGERVALGAPGYPSYRQILKALDLIPVEVQTSAENRLQPTPDDLAKVDYDGLLVASPANPSGTMLDRPELKALIEAAQARGAAFLSDEIYHGIEYDQPSISALEISDDVIVINSFSKYFSMTGWRIGWLVVPDGLVRQVERLAQNMFICPSHASQVAALAAIDAGEELDANVEVYKRNRTLMMDGLRRAGFDRFAPPDGAFYIYADISHITRDSRVFAREILEEAGVAVTPGLDFDPVRGAGTLRFAYAQSTEDIEEGLDRLQRFMQSRGLRAS